MGRGRIRVQVGLPAIFRLTHILTPPFLRPERWEHPPEAISAIPGVWSHLLTFLGGPHACIGYRFSLVEYVTLSALL